MSWHGLTLTNEGRKALTLSQQSNTLSISSIEVGDGDAPSNFNIVTSLVRTRTKLNIVKVDNTPTGCTIVADFEPAGDYYFKEIGIFCNTNDGEKLCYYDNCESNAEYIQDGDGRIDKRIVIDLVVTDVDRITLQRPSVLYVTQAENDRALDNKVDKVSGKGLSTNDYTNDDKSVLASLKTEVSKIKEYPHYNFVSEKIGDLTKKYDDIVKEIQDFSILIASEFELRFELAFQSKIRVLNGFRIDKGAWKPLEGKYIYDYSTEWIRPTDLIDVYFDKTSITTASKVNINVESLTGKIRFEAKKIPSDAIIINNIKVVSV